MHAALRTGSVEAAIIIGGSNAGQLADCCTALGLDVVKHFKSGWKTNKDSVDKILPDLLKTLSQTPVNVPIIIQGLDNSSYFGTTEDGGMAPLSQCVPKDKGFHAVGALVVAPERSISSTVTQLNRLISACGDRQGFILSVMPRFIIRPCCDHPGHMTNFLDENYLKTILPDLTSLRASVKKMLVGGQLVDILELIFGEQYTMERAETAARTGWTTDPVHPSRHTVAKIGLHLIEKMGNYTPVGSSDGGKKTSSSLRLDNRGDRKRRRDDSSEEERVSSRTPGVRAGRRGDPAVATCGAAAPDAVDGALGDEVATATKGAAAMAATETKTPRTTVDRKTDSTTPDTRAGGRKAAAADTEGDRTAADMTAGATLTEVDKNVLGIFHTVYLFFLFFYETVNSTKVIT
jgi:hypothetical protein